MAERKSPTEDNLTKVSLLAHEKKESSALTDTDAALFRSSLQVSRYLPIIALALLGLVTTFLVLIVFLDVPVRKPGVLSNDDRALYITGTALSASLISSFVTGQIKLLWTARILNRSAGTYSDRLRDFARARVLFGIGTIRNQLRFWASSGSVLLIGLITTAIVAGVTPSISQVKLSTMIFLNVLALEPCFGSATTNASMFSWTLSDGSVIGLLSSGDSDCAIKTLPSYFPGGDEYGYSAGGVEVHRAALGTPFNPSGFGWSLGYTQLPFTDPGQRLLRRIDACSPVIVHNPVKCSITGNLTVERNELMAVADGCTIKSPILAVDPAKDGASVLGACTAGLDVGKATIVLGAVNDHALKLAEVMGTVPASSPPPLVVACHVDVAPSIDFRSVVYNITPPTSATEMGMAQSVDGTGETCQPHSETGPVSLSYITTAEATLAYGAAASYRLLTENADTDGWWPTIYQQAEGFDPDLGEHFQESTNGLEDALGLATGIVLSNHWGNDFFNASHQPVRLEDASTCYVSGVRVGPGSPWALVYILPELYAICVLVYLVWKK